MSRPHGSRNRLPRADDAYGQVFLEGPLNPGAAQRAGEWLNNSFLLSQQTLQDIYLANGMGRRIVDCVAEEMTRAGFELENIADPVKEKVQARIEELEAMTHLTNAIKWARAFGGSCIVLGIDDGGRLDMPVRSDNVRGIEFMRVYDRYEIQPMFNYTNPLLETYGRTEIWQVSPSQGGNPYNVHETRMLIFDGDPLPNRLRNMNMGWGASVLQKCVVELRRLNNSHKWSELLLQRLQQAIHKIPDLSNTLSTAEGVKQVAQRVDIVDRVRSAQNTVVVDALEDYEVLTGSLAGVSDVLDRHAEALSAVTDIPIYRLMGRSPGGLNATGESNETAWYNFIENQQNVILKKKLDRIISFIILGAAEGVTDGGNYSLKFCPLHVPEAKEAAETELANGQAAQARASERQTYVNMGSLDPTEVREALADTDEFREYIDVSIQPTPPAQLLLQQQAQLKPPAGGAPGGGRAPAPPAKK